jgi:AcrR family transcriptional regulator
MVHKRGRYSEGLRNDRLLLQGAKAAVARKGAAASIADIASASGLGVGSIYRRFPGKEQLFQRLCTLAMQEVAAEAERALERPLTWENFAEFITVVVEYAPGLLATVAGTLEATEEMWHAAIRQRELLEEVVRRAHKSAGLRSDVSALDIQALIAHLGHSSLVLSADAQANIRKRLVAIALAGLREPPAQPLPGYPPAPEEFDRPWRHEEGDQDKA